MGSGLFKSNHILPMSVGSASAQISQIFSWLLGCSKPLLASQFLFICLGTFKTIDKISMSVGSVSLKYPKIPPGFELFKTFIGIAMTVSLLWTLQKSPQPTYVCWLCLCSNISNTSQLLSSPNFFSTSPCLFCRHGLFKVPTSNLYVSSLLLLK
jgi:hypothetical protein